MQAPDVHVVILNFLRKWNRSEIYRVQALRFPLEDVTTLTHVIGSSIDSEDDPVIFMFQFWHDFIENNMSIPYVEHLFHVNVNRWKLCLTLLRLELLIEESSLCESILHILVGSDEAV